MLTSIRFTWCDFGRIVLVLKRNEIVLWVSLQFPLGK